MKKHVLVREINRCKLAQSNFGDKNRSIASYLLLLKTFYFQHSLTEISVVMNLGGNRSRNSEEKKPQKYETPKRPERRMLASSRQTLQTPKCTKKKGSRRENLFCLKNLLDEKFHLHPTVSASLQLTWCKNPHRKGTHVSQKFHTSTFSLTTKSSVKLRLQQAI